MKTILALALAGLAAAIAGAQDAAEKPPAHPYRLLILGPPGVGKSSQAKRLAADFGLAYVSSGDMLRARAKKDLEIAKALKEHTLVPFPVVHKMIRERLAREDARKGGFILDGFPRRLEDAVALQEMLPELHATLDAVIDLEVPQAEYRKRFLGRGEKDDTEEVFAKRLKIYREETAPVLEFFKGKLPILSPDVTAPDADLSYRNVRRAVERLASGPGAAP